jgi:hypothetical protein
MINQDYKKALSELCKLKKIGILNKKNNDRWLACLETITDNRRIIIKNLHTVIRSELFINLLPKNVYEYFKDDLSFEEVDTFFRNLQEYYSDKKENTELQRLRTEFNIAKQKILKLENDTYEKRECKNILCNAVFTVKKTKQKDYCERKCKVLHHNYLNKKIRKENQILIQCANDNCQKTFARNGAKKYCSMDCSIKNSKINVENIVKPIIKEKQTTSKIAVVQNIELLQKPVVKKSLPIKIITKITTPKLKTDKDLQTILEKLKDKQQPKQRIDDTEELYIPNRDNATENIAILKENPSKEEFIKYLFSVIKDYKKLSNFHIISDIDQKIKKVGTKIYSKPKFLNLFRDKIKALNCKITYTELFRFSDTHCNLLYLTE